MMYIVAVVGVLAVISLTIAVLRYVISVLQVGVVVICIGALFYGISNDEVGSWPELFGLILVTGAVAGVVILVLEVIKAGAKSHLGEGQDSKK
jgi:predicted membrane channel-forming protein YqfA (hemolysin III family)